MVYLKICFQVVETPLCFPSVIFPENSSDIDHPLSKKRQRELRFITLITYPACNKTISPPTYEKRWTISRIHMQNRGVVDDLPLNLTTLHKENEEIRFLPYVLSFGTYKIQFTLSLPTGQARTVFTYFRIEPSPLTAIAYRKQSSLTLGRDQSVSLPAQSQSMNPNEPDDGQSVFFDKFSWSCRPLASVNSSESCFQGNLIYF